MKKRIVLRSIGLVMLAVAIVFIACALANPQLGSVIYIGEFAFGAEQWRVCYAIYVIVLIGFLTASFLTKKG